MCPGSVPCGITEGSLNGQFQQYSSVAVTGIPDTKMLFCELYFQAMFSSTLSCCDWYSCTK